MAYVSQLPRDSATAHALLGTDAMWTLEAHLLAAVVDAENVAIWQRQGDKNRPQPQPVPRPGVTRDINRLKDRLARWRRRHGKGGDTT